MKVYLIRHAQSEENATIDAGGRVSVTAFNELLLRSPLAPLTPLGERQAALVLEKLRNANITRLYSSPFLRARRTAEVVGTAFDLETVVVEELREVLPPPLPAQASEASFARYFVRSYLGMFWPVGQNESWRTSYRRAQAAWSAITATQAPAVAAVSHRALLSLLLLSLRRNRHWRIVYSDLSNGGVSLVETLG